MSIRSYEVTTNQHWSLAIALDAAECAERNEKSSADRKFPTVVQEKIVLSDSDSGYNSREGCGDRVKFYQLCLIIIFSTLLLVLCGGAPVVSGTRIPVRTHWKSMRLSNLRRVGEETLKRGNVVPRMLDAIEFPVVHQGSGDYVMLQYNLGYNSSPWITITPCTGQLNRIKFSPSATHYERWEDKFKFGLQLTASLREERSETAWKAGAIWVEPFPGEREPPKYTISKDETELLDLARSRVQYSRTSYAKDTMNIRLYGRTGDAYMVRVSTRSSPTHMYDGYPVPGRSPYLSVCLEDSHEAQLEIRWNPALTDSMKPTYCVAINAQENMPYRCTAMARLRPYNTSQFNRPLVFRETDYLRPQLIEPSVYECVNETRARIKLPPQLAESVVASLRKKVVTGTRLYVNVYVINPRTDLSTAYAASVLPVPIGSCQSIRVSTPVLVRVHPPPTYISWNSDVIFQWPETIPYAQLFFQPCQLAKSGEQHYTVHLYEKQQSSYLNERELCLRNITDSGVFRVCDPLYPGSYRLYMDGTPGFKSGQHVARFFFLNTTANVLPKRPAHVDLPTRLATILAGRTAEPVHSQPKQPIGIEQTEPYTGPTTTRHTMYIDETQLIRRSKRHTTVRTDHERRATRLRRYTVDWRSQYRQPVIEDREPTMQHLKRDTRTNHFSNGLRVGVDCNKHQVFISLATHPEPHYYWVYMFPVSLDLERLQSLTNYCEFPAAAFRWISPQLRRPVTCRTYAGQQNLTLFTPAYDRADYPRYYSLLIYAAHGNDPFGHYRQLFVQAVIDACMVTVDSCYHVRPTSCNLDYPNSYPAGYDRASQGFSLFRSTTSTQPQCSLG